MPSPREVGCDLLAADDEVVDPSHLIRSPHHLEAPILCQPAGSSKPRRVSGRLGGAASGGRGLRTWRGVVEGEPDGLHVREEEEVLVPVAVVLVPLPDPRVAGLLQQPLVEVVPDVAS